MLLITFATCSCDAANEEQKEHSLSIFVLGNSYSIDSFSYVPAMLENILPHLDIHITLLYKSGCSVTEHYSNAKNSSYAYREFSYDSGKGWKRVQNSQNILSSLSSHEWDYIVTSTYSSRPYTFADIYDSVVGIYDFLESHTHDDTIIVWMQTPTVSDYDSRKGDVTSDDFFISESNACKDIQQFSPFKHIIPVGTAIQNARHTYLKSLGDCGDLTYDGLHIQNGLPRMIESYVICEFLLRSLALGVSIDQCSWVATQKNIKNLFLPWNGDKGESCGITDSNVSLAKKIAKESIVFPFTLNE